MRFIVLGDLHFSDYSQPELCATRDYLFKAFFEQIKALEVDLVFALGDTANRGTISELSGLHRLAKASAIPFIAITGNHDLYGLEKAEIAPYFLGERTPASVSELYTAFDFGPVRFILLDTSRVKLSSVDWSGFVSNEQLGWLDEEIRRFNANSSPSHLVVMGHHPIYGTTDRSTENMLNIANSAEVYQVFATLGRTPGVYFCGHNHSHSISGPDALGWYFVQTAAPLDCQSFRLVTVTSDRLEIETINFQLDSPSLLEAFQLTRTSIESSFSPKEYETVCGTMSDRRLVIEPMVVHS